MKRRGQVLKASLWKFKLDIAEALTKADNQKRGRPSLENSYPKRVCTAATKVPVADVRFDGYNHWPLHMEAKKRCRFCSSGFTRFQCSKCEVALCLNNHANCFLSFHNK